MPSTPRGYPYPTLSDQPHGPDQLSALATAIDTDIGGSIVPLVTLAAKTGSLLAAPVQATGNVSFGAETLCDSITFTHTVNRYESFRWTSRFSLNTNGVVIIRYRYVSGAGPVTTGGTLVYENIVSGSGANNGFSVEKILPPTFRGLSTGQYTIGAFATAASGASTGVINGGAGNIERDFVGKDCGPV